MTDDYGSDGDRQGGGLGLSEEARRKRRRARRGRGSGDPSLDTVLSDAAQSRPAPPPPPRPSAPVSVRPVSIDGAGSRKPRNKNKNKKQGGPASAGPGGYNQNGYNPGGYSQGGYNQGGYGQNGYAPSGAPGGAPNRGPQGGGRPGQGKPANNKMERMERRSRRVRPVGREDEDLPVRDDPAYKRAAETWWADRWLAVLHRFGWKGRLANGRMYTDEGRVGDFKVEPGRILAKVQGSRTQPYDVTIQIKPLAEQDWDLVVDILSCQALFTAQLLAGDMPQDIEEVFIAAYAPLFPRSKDDIKAHCTCPDWANPCKHIAAVYYAMADAFDKDPFVIFQLRGRNRDHLIGMLRAQRAADAQLGSMSVETLDMGSLEPFRFWQAGEELEAVQVKIGEPPFPGATAKRLGRPPFWRSPADPVTRLSEVYEAIARRAREVALNEAVVVGRAGG